MCVAHNFLVVQDSEGKKWLPLDNVHSLHDILARGICALHGVKCAELPVLECKINTGMLAQS